jgi:hypothetical protein
VSWVYQMQLECFSLPFIISAHVHLLHHGGIQQVQTVASVHIWVFTSSLPLGWSQHKEIYILGMPVYLMTRMKFIIYLLIFCIDVMHLNEINTNISWYIHFLAQWTIFSTIFYEQKDLVVHLSTFTYKIFQKDMTDHKYLQAYLCVHEGCVSKVTNSKISE